MMKKIPFIAKSIALTLLIVPAYIAIIYTVEQLNLVSVTTISNVRDSHFANIYVSSIFLLFRAGWVFLLAVIIFHYIKTQLLKGVRFWSNLVLGVILALTFFLPLWGFGEQFDSEVLKEGLIVYPIIGIALALLHRLFFKVGNSE